MNNRIKVLVLSVLILLCAVIATSGLAFYSLYHTAYGQEEMHLGYLTKMYTSLMEAVADFNVNHNADYPGGPRMATLHQLNAANKHRKGFGRTGEFTMARRDRDDIVFEVGLRYPALGEAQRVPFDSEVAEPMQMALQGATGTLEGRDYRGTQVLAAYAPVKALDLGFVAKMDVAEVREPFLHTALAVALMTLLVVCGGSVVFLMVANPFLRRLEESEEKARIQAREVERQKELLQKIVDNIPVMLCLYDTSDTLGLVNREFERLLGWSREDVRNVNDMLTESTPDSDDREHVGEHLKSTSSEWRDLTITARDGREVESSWANVRLSDGTRIGIGIDITERKKTETTLALSLEKLRRSNEELQEFAFVASHDLQEPLRKIRTFSDILMTKYDENFDKKARDYLIRMSKAAERMQDLILALLDYSRLESEAQQFEKVDLAQAARDAADDLEVMVRHTEAVIEIDDDLASIEAEPNQMRDLFQNLIGNAMRFRSSRRPMVKVYGTDSGGSYRIFVEDNGLGFDEKYLDRIFIPFQRLHSLNAYSGAGMGLAICRKIVERHGGTITATSVREEGATFIVTLPYTQTWLRR